MSSLSVLVERAQELADSGQRRLLGITGPPGCGKGTVADALVQALGSSALVVPMDGFHLSQAELRRLGRRDRMGAPDTFDVFGYVDLLRRIRRREPVSAPAFDREIEEAVPDAISVPADVPLVITEGNYLLLDTEPWDSVAGLLHESWFLAPDHGVRVRRLVARHVRFGKTSPQAHEWVSRSDERNAALVAPSRSRADLVVEGDPTEA
ncbi:nucleoside/nucleotide kinase family protein [Allosaccharopolyspora coralli]|uniref:Nucleoside/nucleotide kinase family protein n=1 Tax=Allosaccharopolyspora coralli TaxID=2665642 RepID=A0A5Q3Q9B8_9PSEU|nr:nucleoside/nucleotide kinase family protein [Allosaccharopolyspora coralli]QGK71062.1 nucleoside/nucleotide kinase family protein [Allosaccharopolyspora coralli]